MAIYNTRPDNKRLPALVCLIILLIIAGKPLAATAADTGREDFKIILQESLEALWSGREFSPELAQRQQILVDMLTRGAVEKPELEIMIEQKISSILNSHKTSRYVLKTIPERVNRLFSPYLEWNDFKKIVWRAVSSPIPETDPLLIKVGTLAPPGTPWLNVPENISFPEIAKLSDNRIIFKIYGGGVMGEDTDVLSKMESGQLDSCGCTALGVLEVSPEISTLLIPYLFKNYEEVDYICEKFRKRLDEGVENRGYILTAIIDTGFFYMFSRNKTTSLEDVRKQKVITWFGAIEASLYKELGFTTMRVPVPDTVSALDTGLVDINVAPAAWMLGMQAYQYSNYYLKPPLVYSPAVVVIKVSSFNRVQEQLGISATFTHNLKEIITFEFNAIEPEWKRLIRIYEEKSLKAFEAKCGMKSATFSPEDQRTIERASKAVQQNLAGKVFPKDLMNDIIKALIEYRAKH